MELPRKLAANYDFLVFDLDGTLVDSLPDIASALNRGLAGLGRPPVALAEVRALVGDGVVRLAEKALALRPAAAGPPDPPAVARALAAEVRTYYEAHPCVHSQLYPGIADLVHRLRAEPARRLAVLTNKPAEVTRPLLAALGLARSFDAVIGDGDGYPRKPDPAAAWALLARFSCDPGRALVVGDGVPDLLVAGAVGCDSAGVLWGYSDRAALAGHAPTYLLETPADVLRIA
jgi:phosphoglycolate phosphatase